MSAKHDKLTTIKITRENRDMVMTRVKVYAKAGLKVSFNSAANLALKEGLESMRVPNPDWENATHDVVFPKPTIITIKRKK